MLLRGVRLGPYEILAPLGAGGMGEVYRARDTRLGRNVALKVVSAEVAGTPRALARFEREARAVAALSHPNILAIHDVGQHSGTAYAVTELLEGETLRARLAGSRMAVHKVVDYAVQMARGLAAAHDKGIVHRDLKPENVFVTRQLPPAAGDSDSRSPTLAQNTEPGKVLGTPAYMAPEQARGEGADARTDIFALGAVLHEMLTGRRAFARQNAAETMAAILKEDPPDLAQAAPDTPPEPNRIVRHCLEKNPGERFRSAHDLAFDLASLSGAPSGPALTPPSTRPGWRVWRATTAAVAAAALVAGGLGYWTAIVTRRAKPPSFQRLTFRRGHVTSARFTPDRHTIVYGAMWEGGPTQVFSTRLGRPESSALDLPPADILSVSATGELAVSLGRRHVSGFMTSGRLARVALGGGAPRELLDGVLEAEWASDGERLLVVRDVDGTRRLEFPAGRVLYETPAWIGDAHLSPRGDLVAFADHPYPGADNGSVVVIPTPGAGTKKTLTREYPSLQGLAWAPGGREIWFTGAEVGWFSTLQAVTPSGAQRLVARVPGRQRLHEIDDGGRVLLAVESTRVGTVYGRGDGFPMAVASCLPASRAAMAFGFTSRRCRGRRPGPSRQRASATSTRPPFRPTPDGPGRSDPVDAPSSCRWQAASPFRFQSCSRATCRCASRRMGRPSTVDAAAASRSSSCASTCCGAHARSCVRRDRPIPRASSTCGRSTSAPARARTSTHTSGRCRISSWWKDCAESARADASGA